MTAATETVPHQRQCPHCDQWFGWMAIGPHCASHSPLWCVCEHPTVATAYGWTYCENCQRGLQPEAVAPNQTQQQEGER